MSMKKWEGVVPRLDRHNIEFEDRQHGSQILLCSVSCSCVCSDREASPPGARRTPERTQSLRERESPLRSAAAQRADPSQGVRRAESLRDPGAVVMRRRFQGKSRDQGNGRKGIHSVVLNVEWNFGIGI